MNDEKTVLVTGGSSGIGYTISTYFAKAGFRILWVSKPEEELRQARQDLRQAVPNVEIHTFAQDLSLEGAAQATHEWAKGFGSVHVLINNAGFGTHGFLQDIPLEKEVDMVRLNVLAVYQLTRLFLDDMIAQDRGTIINISSNSSFQPVARMTTYSSTKAFVTHFSRGLQEELTLQKSKVRVLTVCPSAIVDTPFSKDMRDVKTFNGLVYTTAAEVAKDVWQAFQNQKTFLITGKKMRFFYALRNLVPYPLQQYLVRKETERSSS
ncbi:MAG: SDR family NAD(P)-dependent oxidoreductase [Saprospiraceae bacterium]|nr:SDR family NAD(P)-dependent oxidoreductase [Saprospiraceae bacterium]